MIETLPEISKSIWEEKYRFQPQQKGRDRLADSTVQQTFARVATALTSQEKDRRQWNQAFFNVMAGMEFLPAGRILAGAGTGRDVTLFNCYVMGTIPDSLAGICDSVRDSALTLKQGGGIGMDFTPLRYRGAPVRSVESVSSGAVSFMHMWDTMCGTIMSAGARRGAMMATLRCDHPDILEFIEAKQTKGVLTNFNVSVLVTDKFMEAVRKNEPWPLKFNQVDVKRLPSARELWEKILRATYDYAEPGVIFIDRINTLNPLREFETISATNPCFTGDTRVWTASGPKTFSELAKTGETVMVLTELDDGTLVFRPMRRPRKTQTNAELCRVTFDNGTSVVCTLNHEFYLKAGRRDMRPGKVRACELQPGMAIQSVYRRQANQKGYMRLRNSLGDAPLEHHVPFRELAGGDLGKSLHVHHKNKVRDDNRIENLELIDASLHNSMHMQGDSNPSRRFPERNALIQKDHSGENNGQYRHDLDNDDIQEMRQSGMSLKAIAAAVGCSKYTVMKRLGWERPNHKVVSVEILDERQDVYCGTVDETGRFFVDLGSNDGVLVANCGEQPLPPYGACLLGSVNLPMFVSDPFTERAKVRWERLRSVVRTSVRMLDNVIEISNYPLEMQKLEARDKRRIGLGVTGLADMLIMLNQRYGGEVSQETTRDLFRSIREYAEDATYELGEEKGSFPLYDPDLFQGFDGQKPRSHRRNSHLLSVAPTGTISLFAGNVSSGIEPVFDWEYQRRVLRPDGGHDIYTIQDYAYAQAGGIATDSEAWVTAMDLKPSDHLAIAAQAQRYVDSAISKTINCPSHISFEEFCSVYDDAYAMGLKGCTTYRPSEVRGSVLIGSKDAEKATPIEIKRSDETNVVQIGEPLVRGRVLTGTTYKIKPRIGDINHALYVTINDAEVDGRKRPIEIFFNTKAVDGFAWSLALARMISAVFRKGGNIEFVAEELMAIFDPRGGFWQDKKFVPSVPAAIGLIIEEHLYSLGLTDKPERLTKDVEASVEIKKVAGVVCPKCHVGKLVSREGCMTCNICTYSKC